MSIVSRARALIDKIRAELPHYRKALVAFAGAVVILVGAVAGEKSETYAEIVALLTSLGVYRVPNKQRSQ